MKHSLWAAAPKTPGQLKTFIEDTRRAIENDELDEYEEHRRALLIRYLQALFDKRLSSRVRTRGGKPNYEPRGGAV